MLLLNATFVLSVGEYRSARSTLMFSTVVAEVVAVVADAWAALTDELWLAKVTAAVILSGGSLLCGLAAVALARRRPDWCRAKQIACTHNTAAAWCYARGQRAAVTLPAMSLFLCAGGGALLWAVVAGLRPAVHDRVVRMQAAGVLHVTDADHHHQLTDLLCAAGFFAAMAVDDIANSVLDVYAAFRGLITLATRARPPLSPPRDEPLHCRSLFAILAMSCHEMFGGLAVGLAGAVPDVWCLLVAVAPYKMLAAFCIGLELTWSGVRDYILVAHLATFSVVTAVGVAAAGALHPGSVDDRYPNLLAVALQALAAGTLLYVAIVEVFPRHKRPGILHTMAALAGYVAVLRVHAAGTYVYKSHVEVLTVTSKMF